ncbi:WD40 repeat-like protein [Phlegmacium glaucopus]|nr:WD40 repeat-like protein [Phlegmacium glaucopus]
MASDEPDKKILRLTVLKGSGLSKPRKFSNIFSTSQFLVELLVIPDDGQQSRRTEAREGKNPRWDASFDLTVTDSSVVQLTVYFSAKKGEERCGQFSVVVKDIFKGFISSPETTYQLASGSPNKASNLTIRTEFISLEQLNKESCNKLPNEAAVAAAVEEACTHLPATQDSQLLPTAAEALVTASESAGLADVIDYVEKILKIGDAVAEVHPYAKAAWAVLSLIPKMVVRQAELNRQIQELWETAADMLSFLQAAQPVIEPPLLPTVSAMMKQIHACAVFITTYGEKGFIERNMSGNAISEFMSAFKTLKKRFEERSALETWKLVHSMEGGVVQIGASIAEIESLEKRKLLLSLPGASLPGVQWDLGKICLPKTRTQLIDKIISWVHSLEDSHRSLWLHGVAGSGKSTIANTIAKIFEELHCLLASFRFTTQTCDNPRHLFGNITSQMARYNQSLRKEIITTVENQSDMNSHPLRNQFKTFIVDPLNSTMFTGPALIVIDALDEAATRSADGSLEGKEEMLAALAAEIPNLPSFVKVLLVSRDEHDISTHLGSLGRQISIDNLPDTDTDIRAYIDHRLSQIRQQICQRSPSSSSDWPTDDLGAQLTKRASGLFQWARVVCAYIQEFDPPGRLQDVLSQRELDTDGKGPSAEVVLNNLYLNILQKVQFPLEDFQDIFGCILCAKMPFTHKALHAFLVLGVNDVKLSLSRLASLILTLGSILQVEPSLEVANSSNPEPLIRILHPSLYDFFVSLRRCTDTRFHINPTIHNVRIAARCFAVMATMLTRDICSIRDPTKFNWQVLDLVDKHIPAHLRYSCRFWARHLMFDEDAKVFAVAKEWLFEHLLHWLEVMSLLDELDDAFAMLKMAETWFTKSAMVTSDSTLELLRDSIRFLEYFDDPIRSNAAHIYISALPFTPPSTMLSKTFMPKVTHIPRVISGLPPSWSACIATHEQLQVSPDRLHLLTPVWGKSHQRQVWSFMTGGTIGVPLMHNAPITFAHYSEDGKFIMAAGADCIIRVWNAQGEAHCRPLRPHINNLKFVSAIVLSPDATRIAVTFDASTLYLWDTVTDNSLAFLNCGPECRSLHFSSDGKHLFIGWLDGIMILDAITGDELCKHHLERLQGTNSRESVMFSAQGTRFMRGVKFGVDCIYVYGTVVSATDGIQVLDSWTCSKIGQPLGPGEASFSPDGSRLVFTRSDTLYIYDTLTMDVISKLRLGCSSITAFDKHAWWGNTLYMSNLESNTIHTIDTTSSQFPGPSLVAPSGNPLSAASWSYDGESIIAIYKDKVVRIWNVRAGVCESFDPLPCTDMVNRIFISRNSKRFITSDSLVAQVWDLDALRLGSQPTEFPQPITMITTCPASSLLIVTNEDMMHRVWHQTTGLLVRTIQSTHTQKITSTACSADGKYFASSCEDGTISVMPLLHDNTVTSFMLAGHTGSVTALTFSKKSGRLASASEDMTIRIWDVGAGAEAQTALKSRFRLLSCIAFSADDSSILAVSSKEPIGTIHTLTTNMNRAVSLAVLGSYDNKLVELNNYTPRTAWATVLPSQHEILSLDAIGQPRVWETATGNLLRVPNQLGTEGPLNDVGFSADGSRAICCYEKRASLQLYDCTTAAEIGRPIIITGNIAAFQFSADGRKLATVSNNTHIALQVWDTDSGSLILESEEWFSGSIISFAFSPDGSAICCSDSTQELRVWDTETGKTRWHKEYYPSEARKAVFSQDGIHVFVYNEWQWVKSFDANTGAELGTTMESADQIVSGPPLPAMYDPKTHAGTESTVVSPDGSRRALVTPIPSQCVVDTETLSITATLEPIPMSSIFLPQFSLDGKRVAAIINHGKIAVWDAATGKHLSQPFQYEGCFAIHSFAFISSSQLSFTYLEQVDDDKYHSYSLDPVYFGLWDFQKGSSAPSPFAGRPLRDTALSPDGKHLLMSSDFGEDVTVWDVETGQASRRLEKPRVVNSPGYFTVYNVAFSPDGKKIAHVNDDQGGIHVWDLISGDLLSHVDTLQAYADDTRFIQFIQFSPDSSKVLCVTDDQLITVWDVSHLPLAAATVTYTYPEHLPLTKDSMTDDQGWFRGRDGKRLLWLPMAFRQDNGQCWTSEPDGKLTIVGNRQAPLFIDASDYIDNVETVKVGWRRGTVCSPPIYRKNYRDGTRPTYRGYYRDGYPQRLLQRALVDNGLA